MIRFLGILGLLFFWIWIGSQAMAQGGAACTLNGMVLDSTNSEPIPFAAVSLMPSEQDSIVAGTLTNEKGTFELSNLRPGSYRMVISFIGYTKKTIGAIQLRGDEPRKNLGRISLAPTNFQLSEVQITDRQDLMLNNIDKKSYNVEKNLVAEGGAVTDVLRTIPSVEIDIDGNLSLRGSGNVTVLIDGKPSSITGAGRSAVLQQIPASSIKSIEVITNPSARFDPDGMAGIINIVTKKNKAPGLNGNLSLGAGTHQKYNSSLGLSYRTKRFNAYGTYSFRMEDRWGRGNSFTNTPLDTISPLLYNTSKGNRHSVDQMVRGGIDFYLSEKTTLGIAGGYAGQNQDAIDLNSFSEQDTFGNVVSEYIRPAHGNESMRNWDGEANLQQKFKRAGRSLDARMAYSQGLNTKNNYFRTVHFLENGMPTASPDDYQNNFQTDGIHLGTAQVDYAQTIGEKNKFEAGGKATSRDIRNTFASESLDHNIEEFMSDSVLNNDFLYKERILAAYGIFSHAFNQKFASQIGLRAEQAFTKSELVATQDIFTNDYFRLFPNAYLSWKPKSGHELRVSYSRRINRPTTEQLNPFTDYSNPKRLRRGNPKLLPEFVDAFELSYNRKFEWGSISSTGYFRYITNSFSRYFTPVSPGSDTLIMTSVNLLNGQNYGLELIGQVKPAKWMDLMVSANFFRTVMNAGNLMPDLTVSNLGMSSNMTATVYLSKNTNLQLTSSFSSARFGPQGRFAAMFGSDIAFKQNFLKGRASINLRLSDIFNTRRFKIITDTEDLIAENYRKRESRIGYVTFTYRFGSEEFTPKRKRVEERSGGEFDF